MKMMLGLSAAWEAGISASERTGKRRERRRGKTSNIQHPIDDRRRDPPAFEGLAVRVLSLRSSPNIQLTLRVVFLRGAPIGCWRLDVGCWMFMNLLGVSRARRRDQPGASDCLWPSARRVAFAFRPSSRV